MMKLVAIHSLGLCSLIAAGFTAVAADESTTNSAALPPREPAFSVGYLDRSIDPAADFYHFADGQWLKDNPVPPDKSRWASFSELAERNWYLIHGILDDAASQSESLPQHSPRREVGDFYASVMDTNRIEKLGLKPIAGDLKKIDRIKTTKDLFAVLADFHQRGIDGLFERGLWSGRKEQRHLCRGTGPGRTLTAGSGLLSQGQLCR